jgi:hypothetical protein
MLTGYGFNARSTQVWNKPKSVDDVLLQIQKDIKEIFKINIPEIQENENSKPIRRDILQNALDKDLLHDPLDGMYLVYGDSHGYNDDRLRPATRTYQGTPPPEISEKRFLGFDQSDAFFDNPAYPWLGWSGSPIKDYNFVPRPWEVNLLRENFNLHPEGSNFTTVSASTPDTRRRLNESIKYGLFSKYVDYTAKETVIGLTGSNTEKSLYWGQVVDPLLVYSKISDPNFYIELSGNQFTKISNHSKTMDWLDFVYILSPPTTFSWGTGYLFFERTGLSNGTLNQNSFSYMTVPIAPANKTPDYSITILRTGTENAFLPEDGIYESIIEVSQHNFHENDTHQPQILIYFENAIIQSVNEETKTSMESYLAGGSGFSYNEFLKWNRRGEPYLIKEIPRTSYSDAWLNSILSGDSQVGRDKYYRGREREIIRSLHPNFNNPIFFSMEAGKLSRYYIIQWTPLDFSSYISIEAQVNLSSDGLPILDEIELRNNRDKVSIPLSFYDFSSNIAFTGTERINNRATLNLPNRAQIEYMAKAPISSPPPKNIPIHFVVDSTYYLDELITFSQEDLIDHPSEAEFSIYKTSRTIQWTPKSLNFSTLKSSINLTEQSRFIIPEQNLNNNIHVITVNVDSIPYALTTKEYFLDYDILTQDFKYTLNQGFPFIASLSPPTLAANQYSSWTASSTRGDFQLNLQDSKSLLSNIIKKDVGSINTSSTNALKYPELFFTLSREALGDRILSRHYLLNFSNPKESFSLNTIGSYIQRNYSVWSNIYTQHEDGSVTMGQTTPVIKNSRQKFLPIEDLKYSPIHLFAYVYNGIPLLNKSIFEGEENTNQPLTKKLLWKGQKYEIPVLRGLRHLDIDGNTKNISWIDGQYERTFQPQDSAHVKFHVSQSLANHFLSDRNASYNNPGNKRQHHYLFAPFSTDINLQSHPYPLRAGYPYIPHARYTAEIETTIYKPAGEQTEHNRIVDEVIKSFTVEHNIPLLDMNGNKVSTIPFEFSKNYNKVNDYKLPYNPVPNNVDLYLGGTEKDLSSDTDPLLREILEGWSFSKDPKGRNSWQNYKYREFIKHSDIREIVEKTTVTFQVNPRYLEKNNIFYTDINASSMDYGIDVYLKPFTNAIPYSPVKTKEYINLDGIILNLRGNKFMDIDGN